MDEIVTIKLFGQQYSFKAGGEVLNAKLVAELLAKEVDTVEKQISGKSPNMTKFTILTLAALNIANEYIELQQSHTDLLENISQRTSTLIKAVDVHLM
ncbi:cell division protein ZapA [bacterium]|nr:cell division protein ZapA [bacterium]